MRSKFISFVCAVTMLLSLLGPAALAADISDSGVQDIPLIEQGGEVYELVNETAGATEHNIITGGTSLADQMPYSADAITDMYQGYLASADDFSYVRIPMVENCIVHATLVCPENARLDYNLSLCSADEEGNLTKMVSSHLGTYIDPNTGKTVDEAISYVHNQATSEYYYVVVDSSAGSSSTDPFYLTISIDFPGTYDQNEPNDNAFMATPLKLSTTAPIKATTTASLNAVNDQDWYIITTPDEVVFSVSAGNYKVDIYQAFAGNILKLAERHKTSGNYALEEGTYYVKVYSDADADSFRFGSYTLELVDQRIYTTMSTACNLGPWDKPYSREYLPWGQSTAFYKFTIKENHKVYVKMGVPDDNSIVAMAAFNSRGQQISDVISSTNVNDVVRPSSGGAFIALPIDGEMISGGIVYLQVVYGNKLTTHYGPSIHTRLRQGSGEFNFTGTCTNPGNKLFQCSDVGPDKQLQDPCRKCCHRC